MDNDVVLLIVVVDPLFSFLPLSDSLYAWDFCLYFFHFFSYYTVGKESVGLSNLYVKAIFLRGQMSNCWTLIKYYTYFNFHYHKKNEFVE